MGHPGSTCASPATMHAGSPVEVKKEEVLARLSYFMEWGGAVVGKSVSLRPPHLCGNAAQLAFPEATFDLVCQSMVFTSILDHGMKQQIAAEMLRVVKIEGLILWYDFHVNNP